MLALGLVPCAAPAQELVQQLPNPASARLADAMERLARRPESVPALIDAGQASLALDDSGAALGFFSRAQLIAPDDGRVLIGLALVALRRGDAPTALQLFENAEAAGQRMAPHAAERGLAYDLVGDTTRAQRNYRRALPNDASGEIARRLAISHAIAGNAAASEDVLLPLLQQQDRAAFRTRAFVLAILGQTDEAVTIAETMLPARLAAGISPFLRYMPMLTPAQQAAAANLGQFPTADQIGRDDPRLAAAARQADTVATAPAASSQQADARLIPGGPPLGPQADAAPAAEAPLAAEVPPARDQFSLEQGGDPADSAPLPGPSFSLADNSGDGPVDGPADTAAGAAGGSPSAAPDRGAVPARPVPPSLAEVFADLPGSAAEPAAAAAAGIDITRIEPAREAPAVPEHPARHWVQLATGRDVAAFRFDWRRLQRRGGDLLAGQQAFHASWGRTNRLLTGPFASPREAQAMVSALAAAGIDSFLFSSQQGQPVSALR